jgi:hypothetical protein
MNSKYGPQSVEHWASYHCFFGKETRYHCATPAISTRDQFLGVNATGGLLWISWTWLEYTEADSSQAPRFAIARAHYLPLWAWSSTTRLEIAAHEALGRLSVPERSQDVPHGQRELSAQLRRCFG